MKFQTFQLREVVLLAILAAVLLLTSAPVAPIVMTVTKLGVQAAAMALMFSAVSAIALRAVPKPGALLIVGLFSGLVLLFMAAVMLFNQVIAAFLAEAVSLLIFRSYRNKKALLTAAGLYPFFTIPTTGLFNFFAKGLSFKEQIGNVPSFLLVLIAALGLGFLGSFIGQKIADALERAGKIG